MMNTIMRLLDVSRRMFFLTVVGATSFAFCSVGAAPLTLTWNGGSTGNLSDETWSGGEEGPVNQRPLQGTRGPDA